MMGWPDWIDILIGSPDSKLGRAATVYPEVTPPLKGSGWKMEPACARRPSAVLHNVAASSSVLVGSL